MKTLTKQDFNALKEAAEQLPAVYSLILLSRVLTELGGSIDFYTATVMTETGRINYLLNELQRYVE